MNTLLEIRKAHFIGVGGIGISALAKLLASRGVVISGSDMHLPSQGMLPQGTFHEGHDASNVPPNADIVIYSAAAPETNVERTRAKELGLQCVDYPTALGMVTLPYDTIAVSGTHGKSTTTALLGLMFVEAKFDPSVIVGALVPDWSSNLRVGASDLFIAEACEYRRHMLRLAPQTIVLTNIELDHPDYYRDLEDVMDAFREYVGKLGDEGLLVYNRDNANTRKIAEGANSLRVSYGIGEGSDLYARDIVEEGGRCQFSLVWKGASIGEFTTELPGIYNLYNILAASAALLAYGGHTEHVARTLTKFHGVGRRFEVVGMHNETTVVSDYAHHPTALREVLHAAQSRFAGRSMLTIFQPHQRERTLKLWKEFVSVLAEVPHAVLVEPYAVPGREDGMEPCGKRLVEEICKTNPRADILYALDLGDAERIAKELAEKYEVILVVGAGDIDGVARRLAEKKVLVEMEPNILQTTI